MTQVTIQKMLPLEKVREGELSPGQVGIGMWSGKRMRFTLSDTDEVWFFLEDVCRALELNEDSVSLSDDKKSSGIWFGDDILHVKKGSDDPVLYKTVTEPGFYSLVWSSAIPEAAILTDWVYQEVLPSIRKTGKYKGHGKLAAVNDMLAGVELMTEQLQTSLVSIEDKVMESLSLRTEAIEETLSKRVDAITDNLIDFRDETREVLNTVHDKTQAIGTRAFDQLLHELEEGDNKAASKKRVPKVPTFPWSDEHYLKFRMWFSQLVYVTGQSKAGLMSTIWLFFHGKFKYGPKDITFGRGKSKTSWQTICYANEEDPEGYPATLGDVNEIMAAMFNQFDGFAKPIPSFELWTSGKALYAKLLHAHEGFSNNKKDSSYKDLLDAAYSEYKDFVVTNEVFDIDSEVQNWDGPPSEHVFSFEYLGSGNRKPNPDEII
jgi:prophage antirepressor-like protein